MAQSNEDTGIQPKTPPVRIWFPDAGNANGLRYYLKVLPKGGSGSEGGIHVTLGMNPEFTQPVPREYGIDPWEQLCIRQWIKDNLAELRKACDGYFPVTDVIESPDHVRPAARMEISSARTGKTETTGDSLAEIHIPEALGMGMYRKEAIRKGKRVVLVKTNKEDCRIEYDADGVPRETMMKPGEKLRRRMGQVSAQEKRNAEMDEIQRKKQISMKQSWRLVNRTTGKMDPED